jgi:hypothetical protein
MKKARQSRLVRDSSLCREHDARGHMQMAEEVIRSRTVTSGIRKKGRLRASSKGTFATAESTKSTMRPGLRSPIKRLKHMIRRSGWGRRRVSS